MKFNMKKNRIALYVDLLFCLVIMPLVIMTLPVNKLIVHESAFLVAIVIYVYFLYFIYRTVNIPKLLMNKKYINIIVLILALIVLTQLFTRFPLPSDTLTNDNKIIEGRLKIRTQIIWFFFLIVTGFALAIELTFELFRQILLKHEIAAEKDKAELALYKAQINPHFLFNTLNTIYALVLSGSDKTESALVKFSNILRYIYEHTESETIPIKKEIEYIRQYVDLQSLRLNRHTKVNLDIAMDDQQAPVPPMILITFIENAFKYGTSSEKDCTIYITIKLRKGVLDFSMQNNIMRMREDKGSGIGIANCRKRLELLYPGRFDLKTTETDNIFNTRLTLRLQ